MREETLEDRFSAALQKEGEKRWKELNAGADRNIIANLVAFYYGGPDPWGYAVDLADLLKPLKSPIECTRCFGGTGKRDVVKFLSYCRRSIGSAPCV